MQAENYTGTLLSFRNDRMGARLMTLMNTIRIAQDYDIPYAFAWKTDGRTSEELLQPTQIFDETYFDDHHIPMDPFREVVRAARDVALLPDDSSEADLRASVASGATFVCQASNLLVLPWEESADVAPRYAAAIKALKFSPAVTQAMAAVDATLADSGTAFHIRRGDIIYDPITSNQLWSNKYIPREFYEVLAKRLIVNPDARILVFSDEPAEITRLKALGPQILGAEDVVPKSLTLAQRDFIELYAMSRCAAIYGPPGSGFSMTAGLMGNRTVEDVRDVMEDDDRLAALDLLVSRLQDQPDHFLSDGDIGQSLPFAVEHLNRTKRSAVALALLQSYQARGFSKVFFFKMLLRQNMIAGQHSAAPIVLNAMAEAPLDRAVPGRLESYWGELNRTAAIANCHAGDLKAAKRQITLAVWHAACHRPTMVTLAQMCSGGLLDPTEFPIPFDPDVSRPIPAQLALQSLVREGHPALVPPGIEKPQTVMPSDLIAYDWRLFLGKSLGRGFGQPETIARLSQLFETQFTRHLSPELAASVQGLYAHAAGDYSKAMGLFDLALGAQPENPLWIKRAAMTRLAVDADDAKAGLMLEQAADIGGAKSLYQAQWADYLWSHGQRPRALRIMQSLCEDEQVLPELAFITARMMRQSRQTGADALAYIDQALADARHMRRFMSLRTQILLDMKNTKGGIAAIDEIVARFGDAGDVPTLRARANEG